MAVKQGKALVMVAGIIDQAVIGQDNALRAPGIRAQGIDVALGPAAALGLGQQTLQVAEAVPPMHMPGQYGSREPPFQPA